MRNWFDGKALIARQLAEDGKASDEGQKGGELKDDRADIAALSCMTYREDRPTRLQGGVELAMR
jgi:hypothetical protein